MKHWPAPAAVGDIMAAGVEEAEVVEVMAVEEAGEAAGEAMVGD